MIYTANFSPMNRANQNVLGNPRGKKYILRAIARTPNALNLRIGTGQLSDHTRKTSRRTACHKLRQAFRTRKQHPTDTLGIISVRVLACCFLDIHKHYGQRGHPKDEQIYTQPK